MEGTDGTWKTFAECREEYMTELQIYLIGENLHHMLSEMSGCKVDHHILTNFVEEGNVAYIESGDLEGAFCYGCNTECKRKSSKRYVTLSTKEPAYTCENRNKGCKRVYCNKCFSGGKTKEVRKESRRTTRRMCKKSV